MLPCISARGLGEAPLPHHFQNRPQPSRKPTAKPAPQAVTVGPVTRKTAARACAVVGRPLTLLRSCALPNRRRPRSAAHRRPRAILAAAEEAGAPSAVAAQAAAAVGAAEIAARLRRCDTTPALWGACRPGGCSEGSSLLAVAPWRAAVLVVWRAGPADGPARDSGRGTAPFLVVGDHAVA